MGAPDWKAKNYAIVFLNHGGTLNQMCFEESSGKWMDALMAAEISAAFQQQQRRKGAPGLSAAMRTGLLENTFSFAEAAEYTLVSPLKLGAPNTYYSEMLHTVGRPAGVSGADVASSGHERTIGITASIPSWPTPS